MGGGGGGADFAGLDGAGVDWHRVGVCGARSEVDWTEDWRGVSREEEGAEAEVEGWMGAGHCWALS